ncbi:MAG: hypothetical protein JW737_01280 [Acidobacteria bacterium]|nr:hypothetical protein [Acidobacteriota bacterium]
MKTNVFLLFLLILFIAFSVAIFTDTSVMDSKYEKLLDEFLSVDYMNADNCDSFRAGQKLHEEKRVELLYLGIQVLPLIMEKLDDGYSTDEVQEEWLFRLAEEICYKDPSGFQLLKDKYQYYYDLIAACRTREAFEFLAEEANNASGDSGFSSLIESIAAFSTDDEYSNDEDTERLTTLLILLGIDGENFDAFTALVENNDEGFFLFSVRLMDVFNRSYIKQPYLSEDYSDMLLRYIDEGIDVDILGMILGKKDRISSVKDLLMDIDITTVLEEKKEKLSLYYQWYIAIQMKNKILDKDVIKKFLDFAAIHDLETLGMRRDIAKQCGKGDTDFAKEVCDFIFKTPSLRKNDPVENCIYPELTNYSEVITHE